MKRAWVIARHTFRTAFHSKAFLVLAGLVVVLTPLLPYLLRTSAQQTAEDQMKLVITYSLALIQATLAVMTLFLGSTLLTDEIAGRQIFILDSKPIRRWEIVAGKFLGLALINAALLAAVAGATYGSTHVAVNAFARSPEEVEFVRSSLMTARHSITPEPPDYRAMAEQEYQERMRAGGIRQDTTPQQFIANAIQRLRNEHERIQYGEHKEWTVTNVPRPIGGRRLTLRVRYDDRNTLAESAALIGFRIGEPGASEESFEVVHSFAPKSYFEFQVPYSAVVAGDDDRRGQLRVVAINLEPSRIPMVFGDGEGLEVLAPGGTFAGNLARGMALIYMQLVFLGAVSMLFSCFVSMPVALAASFAVYMLMVFSGLAETVLGAISVDRPMPETVEQAGRYSRDLFYTLLFSLVPSIDRYSPIEALSTGRFVAWNRLALGAFWVIVVRGGLCVALGSAIFSMRELAQTTSR